MRSEKLLLSLLVFSFSLTAFSSAPQWTSIGSNTVNPCSFTLVNSDVNSSVLKFNLQGFNKTLVTNDAGEAFSISIPGATPMLNGGYPDLAKATASVIIPDLGNMGIEVISSSFTDINDIDIVPSKGNLSRTINPSDIPYRYNSCYTKDEFWPSQISTLREPYILRDYRGQTVVVNPFQYNPVKRVLRVYTDITIRVSVTGTQHGVNEFSRTQPLQKINAEFAQIYQNHFKNFNSVQYVPTSEGSNMLIICNAAWMSEMEPLVNWKRRKGINTEIVDVQTAGGNPNSIKSYISNYYTQHGLNYVLLVGDLNQVQSLTTASGLSDPSYGYLSGSDSYCEVFVGRFSAESIEDVRTQVQRVVQYESNPDTTLSFYNKGVVIGSDQGPGDDGEMDWEHAVNMRADLIANNFSTVTELYDGSQTTTTDAAGNPAPNDLGNALSAGATVITYTGHGSYDSFSTTSFGNTDIAAMTNDKQLPFIWSVACQNGDFSQSNCFGETFLRAQKNGKPTGAIATFMSSINQSWSPPMDAQDEMIDLLVNSYANNIKRTFAGISVNGCFHMNDEYGAQGADMTDTWIVFGDPSLEVRTAKPQVLSVTHQPIIFIGESSLPVNCLTDGALVSLNLNGQILSTGVVTNGTVQLNFSQLTSIDSIFVTVTGYNMVPYSGYILVVPANGPFVVYKEKHNHDVVGNNDSEVDFGEEIQMDVDIRNAGNADANVVSAVLSTTDTYINITDSTSSVSVVNANSVASMNGAFAYTVSDSVPDQHIVLFTLKLADNNGNVWTSSFNQIVNAPLLLITDLVINDATGGNGNGILEAGESAELKFTCSNSGHSDVITATTDLSTTCSYLTLLSNSMVLNNIAKSTAKIASFNVTLDPNITIGTPFDLSLAFVSGYYKDEKTFGRSAGILLEDFETGDFTKYNWVNTANVKWITSTVLPYEGAYSAVSGNVNDGEESYLTITFDLPAVDTVSFWYKVSSEQDWDFFRVLIDNGQVAEWSGEIPWSYAGFDINPGIHTVKFAYQKDNIATSGSDCAWLDNIRLPFGATVTGIETNVAGLDQLPFPNPSNDNISFNLDLKKSTDVTISIYNMQGSLVRTSSFDKLQAGKQLINIPVSDLAQGMYMARIQSGNDQKTYRINVIH